MFELSTISETPQALRYALRCSFHGSSSSPTLPLVKGKIREKTGESHERESRWSLFVSSCSGLMEICLSCDLSSLEFLFPCRVAGWGQGARCGGGGWSAEGEGSKK